MGRKLQPRYFIQGSSRRSQSDYATTGGLCDTLLLAPASFLSRSLNTQGLADCVTHCCSGPAVGPWPLGPYFFYDFHNIGPAGSSYSHMEAQSHKLNPEAEQDSQISAAVQRERGRLRGFIRRRVSDAAEAEDILQEVLYELVSAHRLMYPIERVGAWLMQVARNRIVDHFRKKKSRPDLAWTGESGDDGEDEPTLEDLLPSLAPGPEGEVVRQMLLAQIEEALDELPREQREVFVAHELEGLSFKEMSVAWGVGVNTLLSRKRYAVLALRERLQLVYEDWLATA
jgi:RNA polymerase sigma factor (sigma-70 family)